MSDHYCVLPFYSVETDFVNPHKNIYCCRLAPNTDIARVQQSIALGQPAKECKTCWDLEARGLTSERQIHNSTMDYLLDLNIDNIKQLSLSTGFVPKQIKLSTSNLCNGQCVTCNSTWSSAWAQLEGRSTQYRGLDIDAVDFGINWADIVSLGFVGGEPLLEKKNFRILEKLVEAGNTNCFVSIVTNGSVELTEYQISVLSNFSKLNICFSIDGTDRVFEYMRFPLKWDRLAKNIALFRTVTNNLSVSCMISNLNIYYYTKLMTFFDQEKLPYACKQITHPLLFGPGNLPDAVKTAVKNNNPNYLSEVEAFMSVGTYSAHRYEKFKLEVARQDQIKKISIVDYMPEISNLL
jgi:sulfatase maturation enzyme AslB (radical SAM superfamily)